MVSGILFLSVYSYLVKYFTPMMSEVITSTDPVLRPLHEALGVESNATNNSSHGEPRNGEPRNDEPRALTNQPELPNPPVAQTQVPPPVPEPTNDAEDTARTMAIVTVTSNPSGASIWVDDKSTGMVTPSRVEVPARKKFSVTLKKRGYVDFRRRNTTKETIGSRVTANLLKKNVAYLDVEVFPPQDVIITINGNVIKSRSPIQDLEIQANTAVRVRAETRGSGAFDEVTVNLPADKRQSIQLNPRKTNRLPSNLPN